MGSSKIQDRRLPERAKLLFYFPRPEEGNLYSIVRMPFYENPEINESKKARYKSHSLLGRSSSLYTYLGSDSRKLSLNFNISLPHIMEEYASVGNEGFIYRSVERGTSGDQSKFLSPDSGGDRVNGISDKFAAQFYSGDQLYSIKQAANQGKINNTEKPLDFYNEETNDVDASFGDIFGSLLDPISFNGTKDNVRRGIIDVIIYWVNVIRASVVNNAQDPIYGPPIVRLRHGIMYQDVPCICKDYSLKIDEDAGYDLETLLPRRIKVSMSLEEFRAGDYGNFEPKDIIKRDNLAGWEAVIDGNGTMDPGIFPIGGN